MQLGECCGEPRIEHTQSSLLSLPADVLRLIALQVGALERAVLAFTCKVLHRALASLPHRVDRACHQSSLLLYSSALCSVPSLPLLCFIEEVLRVPLRPQHLSLCAQAARHGQLDALRWLRARHADWNETVCAFAAKRGNLAMLRYAREQAEPCAWDARVWCYAARNAHLHVLRYAATHKAPYSAEVWADAAASGHTHVLEWLLHEAHYADSQLYMLAPTPWTSSACAAAAGAGQVATLRWLHERGAPWDTRTCIQAAWLGSLETLRYACEHGAPLSSQAGEIAARNGHVHVLTFLYEHTDCAWSTDMLQCAAESSSLPALEWVYVQELARHADAHVQWFDLITDVGVVASSVGALSALMWLCVRGIPVGARCTLQAAQCGHFDVLRFLHEQQHVPLDADVCATATARRHVAILKYAQQRGAAWDERVCRYAVLNRDLELLKWARAHHAPWSDEVRLLAAERLDYHEDVSLA